LIGGKDNRIREVSPTQTISTVAGTGAPCPKATDKCGDGRLATAAQLSDPYAVAVLPNGGMLIPTGCTTASGEVSAKGEITTVAGTGNACKPTHKCGDGSKATRATLDRPVEVTPVSDGGFLILDSDANRVRYVHASGKTPRSALAARSASPQPPSAATAARRQRPSSRGPTAPRSPSTASRTATTIASDSSTSGCREPSGARPRSRLIVG
jgi:hypothetical protein